MDDVSLTKRCARCNRMGTRGFFFHALREEWICLSYNACENRKYRQFMGYR